MLVQSKAQHEQAQNAVTTLRTPDQPARRTDLGYRDSTLQPQQLPGVCAVCGSRHESDDFRRRLRPHRPAGIYTDRRAHLWAVANFREGQLQHITPGMRAEVYVMSKPDVHFTGVVDSIGFGVTPDADVVGRIGAVLPDVQRTLNWVHLATRFPVRVRVENPPRTCFE